MRVAGCSALVTGGASGLGLAVVRALVAAGARVVVLDLPRVGGGAPVDAAPGVVSAGHGAQGVGSAGGGAPGDAAPGDSASRDGLLGAGGAGDESLLGVEFVAGDVTVETDVAAAVDRAASVPEAPLRIVVTCAGIATPGRAVGRSGPLPLDVFERVLRINTVGTFSATRLGAAAIMATEPIDGERGVIVQTASVAAFDGQIGQAAYAASKGAVAAMTLPLAREFAAQLIRVVTIAPGTFDTPLLAALPDDARASLAAQVPHPSRLGRPEEFAALVLHACENAMLNGETIRLDGAIRMQPR